MSVGRAVSPALVRPALVPSLRPQVGVGRARGFPCSCSLSSPSGGRWEGPSIAEALVPSLRVGVGRARVFFCSCSLSSPSGGRWEGPGFSPALVPSLRRQVFPLLLFPLFALRWALGGPDVLALALLLFPLFALGWALGGPGVPPALPSLRPQAGVGRAHSFPCQVGAGRARIAKALVPSALGVGCGVVVSSFSSFSFCPLVPRGAVASARYKIVPRNRLGH